MKPCVGCTPLQKSEALILKNGDADLIVRPELGGAIQALRWRGHEVLRSGSLQETDITKIASFPLVPVVNRIPNGTLEFGEHSVKLENNLPGTPDFIHGFGWKMPWVIEKQAKSEAVLKLEYLPRAWQWAFETHQKFKLEENSLWTELSVTNLSETSMPAALGFHPYFPITPSTCLQAQYEEHWESNYMQYAQRQVGGSNRKDFTVGADLVDTEFMDTSHYNWQGEAIISEKGRPTISVTASSKAKHLHVFYKPDGDFVANEPTSGRSNMFGVGPRDYERLSPGETFSIWMKIGIEQRAGA